MNYIQNKHRKTYNPEFKLKVVNLYLSGEKSISQLSIEFALDKSIISDWVKKFRAGDQFLSDGRGRHGNHASPGRPKSKFTSELEKLRHEIEQLKGENFLLKKYLELKRKNKK